MKRVYNFSAGPSQLPEEVLKEAAEEMLDCNGTGQSVMEMSHRSTAYEPIIQETEALVRELLNVPDNYKVLFLQGGASLQFAMIPMNLRKGGKAAYVNTGVWSKKAIAEAKKYMDTVDVIATSEDKNFSYIPKLDTVVGDYDYFYYTMNNTIMGTKWEYIPECKKPDGTPVPLVTDASSCILSEPLDVTKFGIVFAGAQKNLAPAGVTLVIIREDLIPEKPPVANCPTMLQYITHSENGSMFNTPPCYTIYMMGKVLKWIKRNGGAQGMAKRNTEKAELLYNYLDKSPFYHATAQVGSRSLMNVPFLTKYSTGATDEASLAKEKEINAKFVKEATAAGLVNLKGHRLVGGMRASIYNAMGLDGVKALIDFMEKFAKEN